MFKIKGLKKRWFLNTVGVICTIGLVCVMLITAIFAEYYYTSLKKDLYDRAGTTAAFFSDYLCQSYEECLDACIMYVADFSDSNGVQLQFADADGKILAVSSGEISGFLAQFDDITRAVASRTTASHSGKDLESGVRVLAVSSPLFFTDGNVIGVLRYLVPVRSISLRVIATFAIALCVLLLIGAIVLFCSDYYNRMILPPIVDITQKAKRISGGSYGVQITADYEDEIGDLAAAINEMSMKINQNEKMQTEFLSSLSHELRTPLTAITGWSETLLHSDALDKETSRGIKIIAGEAKRLTEMVKDLLDFTRIQDGQMTLNMEIADIRADFEDTVYMYGNRLAQEGIRLEYLDTDEEIPEISCDPKRLRQVYLNILDNAAKHGGEGKRIDASICCQEDALLIRIRDYGPGIPEDELHLVKHKFYKGSSKARGTGIGLAVSDEIVQMHGGELTLENVEGGGTLVTVRLPMN